MTQKIYTKKEKAMFNKDAEPIESSATDPNFGGKLTQQGDWEKEFDEIYYYQKVKKSDGRYIFVCQNSHLIEKISQLLLKEREADRAELAGKIKGLSCCYTTPQKLEKRVLELIKEHKEN